MTGLPFTSRVVPRLEDVTVITRVVLEQEGSPKVAGLVVVKLMVVVLGKPSPGRVRTR